MMADDERQKALIELVTYLTNARERLLEQARQEAEHDANASWWATRPGDRGFARLLLRDMEAELAKLRKLRHAAGI